MASKKALRKTMREKKRRAFDENSLSKEIKINRAISACNKKITEMTKKAFNKNKRKVTNQKAKAYNLPATLPVKTEFDEFGVLVLGQNPIGISVRFPDFDQDIYIDKSETPYQELIEQSLIDLAINTIRAKNSLNKEYGLSLRLPEAKPIANYSDRPFVDINKIDDAIEQGSIPIYSSGCLNLKKVYEEAYKSNNMRSYKKEILPENHFKKTSIKKDKEWYLQPIG